MALRCVSGLPAVMSIFKPVFETVALCLLGNDGRAEEKDHSSSSVGAA